MLLRRNGTMILLLLCTCFSCRAQSFLPAAENSVYQYAVPAGERRAYLWIPPDCKYVRGVIISLSNLLERRWLEDPLIRQAATEEGLGIIWVGPGKNAPLNADMKPGSGEAIEQMLKEFAAESGYKELAFASMIPMGHSANGQFSWNVAGWKPERTIAAIPVKTVPFPQSLGFENIPVCYVVGETTEWPQFRVPDPATKPGNRDFFWPVVRQSAINLRMVNENNLVSVVTDPGGGHFDWNERQATFIALYIKKACHFRLPAHPVKKGFVQLKQIRKEDGWLTDTGGMDPDMHLPAPYAKYKGDKKKAYWFFDEETAKAAVAFNGDRIKRKKQMLTFVQDGQLLPVAQKGYAPLVFQSDKDGMTFRVEGSFLTEIPKELIGAGTALGHAPGRIQFKLITGPAVQLDSGTFRLQFDRATGMGGEIWIQEEHPGDHEYRRAVQPSRLVIPAKLATGQPQVIHFPEIGNQAVKTRSVQLAASSSAGLPVYYSVIAGPAVVTGNRLLFTKIPVNSKLPIRVTVVAYQWGRIAEPYYQRAEPVQQTFYIQ